MHETKHQSAFTNIYQRLGHSNELSTVRGCHSCNKLVHEISSLLNIPQSTLVLLQSGSILEPQHVSHVNLQNPQVLR